MSLSVRLGPSAPSPSAVARAVPAGAADFPGSARTGRSGANRDRGRRRRPSPSWLTAAASTAVESGRPPAPAIMMTLLLSGTVAAARRWGVLQTVKLPYPAPPRPERWPDPSRPWTRNSPGGGYPRARRLPGATPSEG